VVIAIGAIAIVAIAGLGIWQISSDDSNVDTQSLAPPAETVDPLGTLPRGWTSTSNEAGGFALRVPPGWSIKNAGAKTTLKAPGSVVVVSVTADRSEDAIEAELQEYATSVVESLGGESVRSVPDPPKAGGPGYEFAAAEGVKVPKVPPGTGQAVVGPPRLEVIVIRRPELAAYPMLIVSGSPVKPAGIDPIVNKLVASLRGRPVTPGPS